jgi:hypothetical protein
MERITKGDPAQVPREIVVQDTPALDRTLGGSAEPRTCLLTYI